VHRIAVVANKLKRGVGSEVMRQVEMHAKKIGYAGVRIDTHVGNIPMRGMLEKNGYKHCGTIYLTDGESRCAYEKLV
jgi:ribosomal protein S18 acetylase RimI-like enzyme